jgi:hypothetical protein
MRLDELHMLFKGFSPIPYCFTTNSMFLVLRIQLSCKAFTIFELPLKQIISVYLQEITMQRLTYLFFCAPGTTKGTGGIE